MRNTIHVYTQHFNNDDCVVIGDQEYERFLQIDEKDVDHFNIVSHPVVKEIVKCMILNALEVN